MTTVTLRTRCGCERSVTIPDDRPICIGMSMQDGGKKWWSSSSRERPPAGETMRTFVREGAGLYVEREEPPRPTLLFRGSRLSLDQAQCVLTALGGVERSREYLNEVEAECLRSR